LYSKTDPIIEKSHSMVFAPFNVAYPGLDRHFKSANLDPLHNHWKRLFDFTADDTSMPTPHWSISNKPEVLSVAFSFTGADLGLPASHPLGLTAPLNPVLADADLETGAEKAAGAGGLLAFDIRKVSQADAQKALEAMENQEMEDEEEGEAVDGEVEDQAPSNIELESPFATSVSNPPQASAGEETHAPDDGLTKEDREALEFNESL
jgi:hypothetical protein